MKLNEVTHAIVDAEGNICGDGECSMIGMSEEMAHMELEGKFVHGQTPPYRVVRVLVVEVEKE